MATPTRVRLAGLVLVALVVRVLAAGFGGPITPDGVLFYLPAADGIVAGDWSRGVPPTHHPLYPLCIALLELIGVGAEVAGRAVSVVAGAVTVIPAFFIGRRIGGTRCAWLCAGLLAFLPQHVRYSGWVQTEALYTLLVTLAAERCVAAAQGARLHTLIVAGGWCALAILTRGEGILLLALPPAAVFLRQQRGRAWLAAGAAVALGLVAAAGMTAKFAGDLERWAYTPWSNNGFLLGESDDFATFFEVAPSGDRLMFYHRLTPEGFDPGLKRRIILEDPPAFLAGYAQRAHEFLVRQAEKSMPWPWLVPMAFGFCLLGRGFRGWRRGASGLRENEHRFGLLLLILFALYAAAFPVYFVQKRFWLSFAPATVTAAALAFQWLLEVEWIRGTKVAAIGLIVAGAGFGAEVFQLDAGWNATVARDAAAELRQRSALPAGAHLLADRQELPFYAGFRSSELPMASWEESLAYALARGAVGFVVEREAARGRGWHEPLERLGAFSLDYQNAEYLCLVFR